jgi:hypothetical protein
MRSGILRTAVATLRLRANAPWPSQIKGTRDAILAWRREQRMRLILFPKSLPMPGNTRV